MQRKKYLIVFIVSMLFAFTALSSTWVREQGRALLYVDTSFRRADEYFVNGNRLRPEGFEFTETNLSIYADYGLASIYTIGLFFPALKVLTVENPKNIIIHLNVGDIDLIQRLQVFQIGGAVFNLELLAGIPTGNHQQKHGLFTGDGEFNIMPGASMGWGFSLFTLPSYLTLQFGVNVRTEGFSHELHAGFQWGLFVYEKKLLLHLEIKRQQSLRTNPEITIKNGLWNNTSYTAYGVGLTYKAWEDGGLSLYYKTLGQIENALGGHIFSVAFFSVL